MRCTWIDSQQVRSVMHQWRALFVLLVCLLTGCASSGPMNVVETSYLAVPSGDNTNFYRITVEADTYYGISNYDSGWFPAHTVDRLYGSTDRADAGAAIKAEEDIRGHIDNAIIATTKSYLDAAQNPDTSEERILALLNAQRRVRAMAGDGIPLPEGAVEVEYDPSRNLALRRAGQKRVFVLGSNPNEVIDKIKAFSESERTSATVLRLADVIRQQRISDKDEAVAGMEVDRQSNTLIVSQINEALHALEAGELANKSDLLTEIEALLFLVESAR